MLNIVKLTWREPTLLASARRGTPPDRHSSRRVNLDGTHLEGAEANTHMCWPDGFDCARSGRGRKG